MESTNKMTTVVGESLAYFGLAGVGVFAAVTYGIPYLQHVHQIDPVVGWFIASGVIVFALFWTAVFAARRTAKARTLTETLAALRIHRLTRLDVVWAVGGLVGVVAITGVVITACSRLFGLDLLSRSSYGTFLQLKKLDPHEYWIFLVWLPYFFFNIAGEELMWRGYLLPRQQSAFGRWAWAVNGALWAMFHAGIGWRIAIVLLPIEFVVPYIVQRRQNTWLGLIIHGIYNGAGFVLVALGVGT